MIVKLNNRKTIEEETDMLEERYPYTVVPHRTIKGVVKGKAITRSTNLSLTKEEVLYCLKYGTVYRNFYLDPNKERVTPSNLDRLHRKDHITVEEYEKLIEEKIVDIELEEEESVEDDVVILNTEEVEEEIEEEKKVDEEQLSTEDESTPEEVVNEDPVEEKTVVAESKPRSNSRRKKRSNNRRAATTDNESSTVPETEE